jgi:hypothetical protein
MEEMSVNARDFFGAWLARPEDERNEIAKLIKRYRESPPLEQNVMSLEHLDEMRRFEKGFVAHLGPASGLCPNCGRGGGRNVNAAAA